MFNKIGKWFTEGNKKSMEKISNIKEEGQQTVQEHLKAVMNSEGFKRGTAKGMLFGTNKIHKAFPQVNVDYVGGYFEAPEGKEDVKVMLTDEGLLFQHLPTKDFIPYSDMKSVDFKTDTEIQKDLTLTRMVAFGIYSLAMKKKKKIVSNYCIINCNYNTFKYSVCFAGDDAGELYMKLFNRLSK